MAIFQSIWASLQSIGTDLWLDFVEMFPGLIVALILIIIGYIVSVLLGHAVRALLLGLRVDKGFRRLKLPAALVGVKMSSLVGKLTKWFIFLIFLNGAVDYLDLGLFSTLLQDFVRWLPHLIVAIVIVLGGVFLGYYLDNLIRHQHKNPKLIKPLATGVRYIIILLAAVIALDQVGVDVTLVRSLFQIILAGIAIGIALAIGLAFGLGNKDTAKKLVERWTKKKKR